MFVSHINGIYFDPIYQASEPLTRTGILSVEINVFVLGDSYVGKEPA